MLGTALQEPGKRRSVATSSGKETGHLADSPQENGYALFLLCTEWSVFVFMVI